MDIFGHRSLYSSLTHHVSCMCPSSAWQSRVCWSIKSLVVCLSLFFLIACEAEITYRTRQLTFDLNTCLNLLQFDEDQGCSTHWQASREGCLVITNHQALTHRLPVRFEETGVIPIDGEADLTGALSFNPEEGGAFSFYLFGQPHMETPNRCETLDVDSVCEGDCKLAMINQPLSLTELGQSLTFTTNRCLWRTATQEMEEIICDETDNDCDGMVDENTTLEAPSVGDECSIGVGACISSGTYQCLAGVGQAPSCDANLVSPAHELCDSIDNDCDGEIDEEFQLGEECMGLKGICRSNGVLDCVRESDLSENSTLALGGIFCRPSEPEAARRSILQERGVECNGEDDDCDGFIDEHFNSVLEECGEGACADSALTQCQNGALRSLCRDGVPTDEDQNCDGIDDDCDGRADESYLPENSDAYCGVGACKVSGLFICTTMGPELICTPNQSSGDDDDCDGIDDDCDGSVDEAYEPTEISCGVGNCVNRGDRVCNGGRLVNDCTPLSSQLDTQCDGEDNDCDGRSDEGYVPIATTCGQGVCSASGRDLCVNGVLIDTCSPSAPLSRNDLCDGFDYDCDGRVDEDHDPVRTECGRGACQRSGELICVQGQTSDTCTPLPPVAGDFDANCDLVDSDCDGRFDEGYVGTEVSCGVGSCVATGIRLCINGDDNSDTCVPEQSTVNDESCNGVDDDCDGRYDEDYPDLLQTTCGEGACLSHGVKTCVSGQEVDSCVAGQPSTDGDVTCNEQDNDCDGRIDEGYLVTATSCGLGVCVRQGLLTCQSGQQVDTCVAPQGTENDDQCDSLDNDCDGSIDESYPEANTTCGLGVCAQTGQRVCISGGEEDTCRPLQSNIEIDRCDGSDQDCDGRIDEDYIPREVSCGTGACERFGVSICDQGVEVEMCTPGQAAMTDQTCDQVDNDCDGSVDEDYVPVQVSCGMSACNDNGLEICTNNGLENTCVPNAAQDDTTCNGVDDDCDGTFDEDYEPPTENNIISCGTGACQNNNGTLICVGGSVTTMCQERPSTGADDDCDSIDDDCDGNVDEHYSQPSTCGLGECQVTSEVICDNGMPSDQCVPLIQTSNFDICGRNEDNNCDGSVTQYSIGDACSVGVGVCLDSGQQVCNNAQNGTLCNAQAQMSQSFEVCNGLDDDCDGTVDNNLMSSNCNAAGFFGVCAQGTQICEGGQNICQPGLATSESTCDGLDNDCDDQIDEERVGSAPNVDVRRLGAPCSGDAQCQWQCPIAGENLSCINSQTLEVCN